MEDLDTHVRERLEGERGEWLRIAEQAGVSHSWLSKFVNGHIPNPGIETLKRVKSALDDAQKARA